MGFSYRISRASNMDSLPREKPPFIDVQTAERLKYRPRRAVAAVAVALVGHAEVEGVGPDGHAAERGRDRGVVGEELIGHHLELLVTADAQVRGSHPDYRAVGDVGEALDDETGTGHLGQPVVVRACFE